MAPSTMSSSLWGSLWVQNCGSRRAVALPIGSSLSWIAWLCLLGWVHRVVWCPNPAGVGPRAQSQHVGPDRGSVQLIPRAQGPGETVWGQILVCGADPDLFHSSSLQVEHH